MKKLISIILIALLSLSCTFAKPNPNAKTYKTYETTDKNAPVVYFIRDITPENLVKIYEALGFKSTGKVGVKISTGESNKSNHLRPELIGDLVKKYGGGTIVECNTAYGGSRSSNAKHKQASKTVDMIKSQSLICLTRRGYDNPCHRWRSAQRRLRWHSFCKLRFIHNFVAFQRSLNGGLWRHDVPSTRGKPRPPLSIGFGSGTSTKKSGKALIHSGGKSLTSMWGGKQDEFTEAMAEASKAVCDYMAKKGGMCYINVMNRLSVDCDCSGNPAEPDMHDIGILASLDPLAIDQACIDLVWTAEDSGSLIATLREQRRVINFL